MPKKGKSQAKSPKPAQEESTPPPQTWWTWLEVEEMASEHGLWPQDILVADQHVAGRWAFNRHDRKFQ